MEETRFMMLGNRRGSSACGSKVHENESKIDAGIWEKGVKWINCSTSCCEYCAAVGTESQCGATEDGWHQVQEVIWSKARTTKRILVLGDVMSSACRQLGRSCGWDLCTQMMNKNERKAGNRKSCQGEWNNRYTVWMLLPLRKRENKKKQDDDLVCWYAFSLWLIIAWKRRFSIHFINWM